MLQMLCFIITSVIYFKWLKFLYCYQKKKTCIMYGGGVFIICDVLLIGSQKMSGEAVKKEKNAWSILWTTAYYEIKSDLFANYYFFIWYSYLTVWIREPSKSNSFIFCKWRYYCNVIIPKQWWLSRNR